MPRVIRHRRVNLPEHAPSASRPVRVVARDLELAARLPAHTHRWHQCLYASGGVVRVSTDVATWVVPPSRAIWIPAGILHAVDILESAQMRSLYVLPQASPLGADGTRVLDVSPLLRDLIADLATDATEADPHRERLVSDLILDELRIAPTLRVGVAMPTDKRLAALCNALIESPSSPRTLDEWAPLVGASARTLTRLFADELDTTFATWRQQMRLAHAAPLVARGWPMSRVAAELGYSSQSAFSAMFRRTFGKSPSAFFASAARDGGSSAR